MTMQTFNDNKDPDITPGPYFILAHADVTHSLYVRL